MVDWWVDDVTVVVTGTCICTPCPVTIDGWGEGGAEGAAACCTVVFPCVIGTPLVAGNPLGNPFVGWPSGLVIAGLNKSTRLFIDSPTSFNNVQPVCLGLHSLSSGCGCFQSGLSNRRHDLPICKYLVKSNENVPQGCFLTKISNWFDYLDILRTYKVWKDLHFL